MRRPRYAASLGRSQTAAPGIQVCEHLPQLAARAQAMGVGAVAVAPGKTIICSPRTHLLTGCRHSRWGVRSRSPQRHDWPCYASGLDYLQPRQDGVPSGVSLPKTLGGRGRSTWPGPARRLPRAPRHDPWMITQDPQFGGLPRRELYALRAGSASRGCKNGGRSSTRSTADRSN